MKHFRWLALCLAVCLMLSAAAAYARPAAYLRIDSDGSMSYKINMNLEDENYRLLVLAQYETDEEKLWVATHSLSLDKAAFEEKYVDDQGYLTDENGANILPADRAGVLLFGQSWDGWHQVVEIADARNRSEHVLDVSVSAAEQADLSAQLQDVAGEYVFRMAEEANPQYICIDNIIMPIHWAEELFGWQIMASGDRIAIFPAWKLEQTPEIYVAEEIPGQSIALKQCAIADIFVPEPTAEPTAEPTPTVEPTEAPTPSPAPTAEPTATPTVEPTATPTAEPTATPTVEPTATPTAEPTATPTAEPTATPTAEPTATPTVEPTATPTVEPTATPTAEPTATPTAEPTATPTVEPTATPTAEPTATPTVEPIATPTVEPTATPTVEPTATPTVEPTIEPTPAPTAEPVPGDDDDGQGSDQPEKRHLFGIFEGMSGGEMLILIALLTIAFALLCFGKYLIHPKKQEGSDEDTVRDESVRRR